MREQPGLCTVVAEAGGKRFICSERVQVRVLGMVLEGEAVTCWNRAWGSVNPVCKGAMSGLMEGCKDTATRCMTLQPSFLFPGYYLALLAPAGVGALG